MNLNNNAGSVINIDGTAAGRGKLDPRAWAKWAGQVVAQQETERAIAKLEIAKDGKALFLPFTGEFGHKIMGFVRLVHFHKAAEKVVCCRPGEQVLYPSATEFCLGKPFTSYETHTEIAAANGYVWHDILDGQKIGSDRRQREWPQVLASYPDYTPISGTNIGINAEGTFCYSPEIQIPFKPKLRGLKVDVCISTRNRMVMPEKNWKHGSILASYLIDAGYTVAVIGQAESSYDVAGAEYMSGDFNDVDAAIELIQNCSLFIGQDGGGAHLASTVGCNMLVMEVPDGIEKVRKFYDRMRLVNPPKFQMAKVTDYYWYDPQAVAQRALAFLERLQPKEPEQPKKAKRKGK